MKLIQSALAFTSCLYFANAEETEFRWSIIDAEAYDPITVDVGDSITFDYGFGHNVYKFNNKAAYDACDFDDAELKQGNGPYTLTVEKEGVSYYGCEVGRHCASGGMKIIIDANGEKEENDANDDNDDDDAIASDNKDESSKCEGSQRYQLEFNLNWTQATTPRGFPSNAHFSDFVVATHNRDYIMWRTGELASQGIVELAEDGTTGTLSNELEDAGSDVKMTKIGDETETGVETRKISIVADNSRSLLSAASMLAPSPDWFIGIRDVELCDRKTGKWKTNPLEDANLFAYDSGSDSGPSFTSANDPTDPVVEIFRLDSDTPDEEESDFFGREALPFGTVSVSQKA